jgi:hypothetical protein
MAAAGPRRHQADLFVTNVLNGTVAANGATVDRGTVLRLDVQIPASGGCPGSSASTAIGSGFPEHPQRRRPGHRPDRRRPRPGRRRCTSPTRWPAGVAGHPRRAVPRLRRDGTRLHRQPAGRHLNGELGLVVAPGGDILTVNSGNGNLVEITPGGHQIAVRTLDSSGSPPGAGALFGLAVKPGHDAVYFVDDATNTLDLLH